MNTQEVIVDPKSEGRRLDQYLAERFADKLSRSQAKRLVDQGRIKIADRAITAHYRVKSGESVLIEWDEPASDETKAENIALDILYEDPDLILVNKPPGMIVHPGHGNSEHTLVNALLYHVRGLSGVGGATRPGIVHRLDKDTSGIMIIAKNDKAHNLIAQQFKDKTVNRVYRVIVRGVVQHDEGVCEEPVGRAFLNRKKIIVRPSGGKEAETHYSTLKRFSKATLLEVRPQTGRTHQIRVHMGHIGHPVIGDALYGVTSPWIARQSVHAYGLGFSHPRTRKKMYQECPMPPDMQDLLRHLESE